jgi:hypothetical protein
MNGQRPTGSATLKSRRVNDTMGRETRSFKSCEKRGTTKQMRIRKRKRARDKP